MFGIRNRILNASMKCLVALPLEICDVVALGIQHDSEVREGHVAGDQSTTRSWGNSPRRVIRSDLRKI